MGRVGAMPVELTGPGDIRAITAIHRRLLDALTRADAVVVDLATVSDPDVTLVQTIEAARRHAAATGKSLSLQQPADGDLADVLERGGFLVRPNDRGFWLGRENG